MLWQALYTGAVLSESFNLGKPRPKLGRTLGVIAMVLADAVIRALWIGSFRPGRDDLGGLLGVLLAWGKLGTVVVLLSAAWAEFRMPPEVEPKA